MSVLLGVNAFAASGEGAARQAAALGAWRGLRGVTLANLQWADEVFEVDGFETHPVLRGDSRTVSGRPGRRLPVVSELFDRLAEIAEARGCRWFAFANSDVAWTQDAIDRIADGGREGYAFSRVDVDAESGEAVEMVTAGVDGFAIAPGWWRAHRRRFRAYLAGEPIWDNVYAAILLAHADAVLLNRDPLLLHARHPAGDWRRSPFALYLNHLAALDRPYFSRWAEYHHRLTEMRARGATEADEMALQREVFRRPPSARERALQAARAAKARLRWAWRRGGRG